MSEVGDVLFVFLLVPRTEENLIMQQGDVASLLVAHSHTFSHSENADTHTHTFLKACAQCRRKADFQVQIKSFCCCYSLSADRGDRQCGSTENPKAAILPHLMS